MPAAAYRVAIFILEKIGLKPKTSMEETKNYQRNRRRGTGEIAMFGKTVQLGRYQGGEINENLNKENDLHPFFPEITEEINRE